MFVLGKAYQYSFIIPLRDEDGNIHRVFSQFGKLSIACELIFVLNRVSGDTTNLIFSTYLGYLESGFPHDVAVCEQLGVGKADAVWIGLVNSRGNVASVYDADCAVSVADAVAVARAAEQVEGIVVGDRSGTYLTGHGSIFNYSYNRGLAFLYSLLFRQRLRDLLCGSKAIHHKWLAPLDYLNSCRGGVKDRWGDLGILVGAHVLGIPLYSVPVRLNPRVWGNSKIHKLRDALALLGFLIYNSRLARSNNRKSKRY